MGIQGVENLAQLRKKRGLTQAQLGIRLGWTQSQVSRFEHQKNVTISSIRKYVEGLGGSFLIGAAFVDDNSYHRINVYLVE